MKLLEEHGYMIHMHTYRTDNITTYKQNQIFDV